MKKIFICLILSAFSLSCSKVDSAYVSKVTTYPIITVTGANPYFVPKGGAYVEPGAIATEGTAVIPAVLTAKGNYRGGTTLDTNVTDEYSVTYTATNKDGFKATNSRKVIVYKTGDLVNSIEGVYKCTISRNGAIPGPSYIDIEYIYIWKNVDGTFGVSDAFGGWYEYGRALGIGYITPAGTINAINIAANNFTFPGATLTNTGFGGTANITSLTVNSVTKKLVLTCVWTTPPPVAVRTFVATLTQVQL